MKHSAKLAPMAFRAAMRFVHRLSVLVALLLAFAAAPIGCHSSAEVRVLPADLPEFHRAAAEGRVDRLRALLDRGTSIEGQDRNEWTALHWAAIEGQAETVKWLLDRGADPNARGNFGMTPLHWAATKGRAPVVSLLVGRGARTDAKNVYGMTPLHDAADDKVVNALLEGGAKLETPDDRGMSPLQTARQGVVAKALLVAGADMRHAALDGSTALNLAVVESLDPTGLSIQTKRADVRLRGQTGHAMLTLRSVTEQTFRDLVLTADSPACDQVYVYPVSINELGPGQIADVKVFLSRRAGIVGREYPLKFDVRSAGKPVGKFDLRVDATTEETPEDRGMIRLGKASLRPAPPRIHYAIYAVVPLVVVIAWLISRRR
jgi:hypothetical protein